MNYIYDIILNFHEQLYDFYDWNKSDNFTHIRKIPLIRISSKDLQNIINNNVIFDNEFLDSILNKTEIFAGRMVKNIDYACILSDASNVVTIRVKDNSILYSKLILEEENEVLEVVTRMKERDINYSIKNKNNNMNLKTRKELEIENFVESELKKLESKHEEEKLKYLYFECFSKKDFNSKKLYNPCMYYKIYEILKLIQINK